MARTRCVGRRVFKRVYNAQIENLHQNATILLKSQYPLIEQVIDWCYNSYIFCYEWGYDPSDNKGNDALVVYDSKIVEINGTEKVVGIIKNCFTTDYSVEKITNGLFRDDGNGVDCEIELSKENAILNPISYCRSLAPFVRLFAYGDDLISFIADDELCKRIHILNPVIVISKLEIQITAFISEAIQIPVEIRGIRNNIEARISINSINASMIYNNHISKCYVVGNMKHIHGNFSSKIRISKNFRARGFKILQIESTSIPLSMVTSIFRKNENKLVMSNIHLFSDNNSMANVEEWVLSLFNENKDLRTPAKRLKTSSYLGYLRTLEVKNFRVKFVKEYELCYSPPIYWDGLSIDNDNHEACGYVLLQANLKCPVYLYEKENTIGAYTRSLDSFIIPNEVIENFTKELSPALKRFPLCLRELKLSFSKEEKKIKLSNINVAVEISCRVNLYGLDNIEFGADFTRGGINFFSFNDSSNQSSTSTSLNLLMYLNSHPIHLILEDSMDHSKEYLFGTFRQFALERNLLIEKMDSNRLDAEFQICRVTHNNDLTALKFYGTLIKDNPEPISLLFRIHPQNWYERSAVIIQISRDLYMVPFDDNVYKMHSILWKNLLICSFSDIDIFTNV